MNGSGVTIEGMIKALFQALGVAFPMGWEILWPLILALRSPPSSRPWCPDVPIVADTPVRC